MFRMLGASPSQGMGLQTAVAAENDEIMKGRAGQVQYGATSDKEKEYEWETRGSPMTLSISVAAVIGKQVLALSLLIIQQSYERTYIMDCDDRVVGLPTAMACEWTKTYVRCFPLLAVVVSLMAASRFLLHHRSFYELLRQGMLLDFDNFPAYKDPLFLILVWSLVNACAHFLLSLWNQYAFNIHNIEASIKKAQNVAFQAQMNAVIAAYMVPAAIFLAFLFSSYDTEAQLVPLSKYIEEDPEDLKKVVAKMAVMEENDVARVVERGLPFQKMENEITSTEAYKELLVEWEKDQARVIAGQVRPDDLDDERLGTWRLTETQWAARLLLDGRLSDERSVNFRYVWYGFCIISVIMLVFVTVTFVMNVAKEWEDVFVDGQRPDVASLFTTIVFAGLAAWLTKSFCKGAIVPCTSLQLPEK